MDVCEEFRLLSAGERRLRQQCRDKISLIISQRAAYWKQRGKFRALREGDANTKFFHARASCRARRNTIRALEVNGVSLIAHDDKVSALTAYYTGILGGEAVAPFTENDALRALRAMSSDSAPGPDGVGSGFYKAAWPTCKDAIMRFLHAFHDGVADLQLINRALIVLIPKKEAAVAPGDFRPVSLQNCPVKILTKLLTSRLQLQIARLIDVDQTGFIIKGRSISENFVLAKELVQLCHKRRVPTLVIKLDFAKAFDSVNWATLLRILLARGFPQKWCEWMHHLLESSKSAVLVNGIPGPWSPASSGSGRGTHYPLTSSYWCLMSSRP